MTDTPSGSNDAPTKNVSSWLTGKCPVIHKNSPAQEDRSEPPDTGDRPLSNPHLQAKVEVKESDDPHDIVPSGVIPASGRGNSDDGRSWLNPSANQLERALKRRGKPIEHDDSLAVAAVHQLVTDESWRAVMEYEDLHARECDNITLARFEGKDGIYSPKAKLMKLFFGVVPFDRHDWTVDRCGKEVTYVIDYYSYEDDVDGSVDYFVDARPGGFAGLFDRARIAFQKWRDGEKWF